ncbi:MAG: Bax inhibitor-1 family protein [Fretibacterium sp.]|nr:Bax inhibitor-1 family protein [Fretibacterium sp.]
MSYGFSVLMFCFSALLLIYAGLVSLGLTGLIPKQWAVHMSDPQTYARNFAKILALTALAPALSGLAGLFGDVERNPFVPLLTLILGIAAALWLGVRLTEKKLLSSSQAAAVPDEDAEEIEEEIEEDEPIEPAAGMPAFDEAFPGLCRWLALSLLLMTGFAWVTAFRLFDPMADVLGYGFFALWGGAIIAGAVGASLLRKRIRDLERGTALIFLMLFSLLTGFILSITMLPYSQATVAQVYLPPLAMFALISLYSGISGSGSFSSLLLWGLAAALGLRFYPGTSWAAFALSVVVILIFVALAGKGMDEARAAAAEAPDPGQTAVTGALSFFIGLMLCISLWILLGSIFSRDRK